MWKSVEGTTGDDLGEAIQRSSDRNSGKVRYGGTLGSELVLS